MEAARDLHQQTLDIVRRVLGDEHPNTLTSMNNLAATLQELGDLEAARDLHQRTLDIFRRVLGEATNDDATYPDSDGLLPGNGALVAAVERAGGVESVVAGKPHPPMADLVLEHLGHDVRGVVVGDRPETDGRFAASLGYEFALVLTGVTGADDLPAEPTPNSVEDDLLSTVESWS